MSEPAPPPFSISDALRFGWTTTRQHLRPLLIIGAAGAFLGLLGPALGGPRPHPLLGLIVQLLQVCVSLAYVRASLALHDDRPLDVARVGELLRGFFPFLLTSVLFGLVVLAGLVLLVVPGFIWMMQFSFSMFLSADRQLDPIACLHESSRLTRGVRWHLFGFWLAAVGVNLLGCLALGVGLLFTVPTTFLAGAQIYRRLQARSPSEAGPQLPLPLSPRPIASH